MSEAPTLKITLVENYLPDAQQSMLKFGELMAEAFIQKGLDVDRISPRAIWGTSRLARFRPAFKWLGYVDKYLIFPLALARYAKHNPERLFHIVDHSNAVYEKSLRGRALVITCHDLMAISSAKGEVAQNPTGWTGRILQAWILRHLQNIKHVVCDSNKTRSEVLRHCGSAAQQKVSVVHIGLNSLFKPIPPEQVHRFLLEFAPTRQPYFFHVS